MTTRVAEVSSTLAAADPTVTQQQQLQQGQHHTVSTSTPTSNGTLANGDNKSSHGNNDHSNGNGMKQTMMARAAFRASLEAKLSNKPTIHHTNNTAANTTPSNSTPKDGHSNNELSSKNSASHDASSSLSSSSLSSSSSSSSHEPQTKARRVMSTMIRVGSLTMAVANFVQICHSAWILSHEITSDVVNHVKDISRTTWSLEMAAQRNWISKWYMNTIYNEEEQLQLRLEASYRNFAILATPMIVALLLLLCCARCSNTHDISSLMRSLTLYLACVSIAYQIYVGSLTSNDAGGYVMIYIGSQPIVANYAVQTLAGFIWDWCAPCIMTPILACINCCRSTRPHLPTTPVTAPTTVTNAGDGNGKHASMATPTTSTTIGSS